MRTHLREWLDIACEQTPYNRGAKFILNEQNRRCVHVYFFSFTATLLMRKWDLYMFAIIYGALNMLVNVYCVTYDRWQMYLSIQSSLTFSEYLHREHTLEYRQCIHHLQYRWEHPKITHLYPSYSANWKLTFSFFSTTLRFVFSD